MQSGQGFQGVFLLLILVRGGGGEWKKYSLPFVHPQGPSQEGELWCVAGEVGDPPSRPHKDPRCVASGALATSLVSGLWPSAGKGIAVSSR